jgi:hypothetical protein
MASMLLQKAENEYSFSTVAHAVLPIACLSRG